MKTDTKFGFVVVTHIDARPDLLGQGVDELEPETGMADVGFIVRDTWQGQGLGTILVAEMIRLARASGVTGLTADVLTTNQTMLHLFHKSGLLVETRTSGGVCRLTMPFEAREPAPAGGDRSS